MSNQRVLQALEAAFTGHQKNSRAQLFQLLSDEFTFEMSDAGDTIVVPVKTDALSIHGIPLQNEHLFLFKMKDGRAVFARLYADTARGRDVISGHAPRHYPRPDLSDRTSLPIE